MLEQQGQAMNSSETPDGVQPLRYNLEVLAHLIYLARRSETEQQQRYLDRAETVIKEMRFHPKLWE
jgi:hypothetical protein